MALLSLSEINRIPFKHLESKARMGALYSLLEWRLEFATNTLAEALNPTLMVLEGAYSVSSCRMTLFMWACNEILNAYEPREKEQTLSW